VLVYDITDEDSFQKVQTWVKELRQVVIIAACLAYGSLTRQRPGKANVFMCNTMDLYQCI
jgi:GTPase SAR1 family protein